MVEQLKKFVKVGICVEGQTEALFVKYVLSRYLFKYNIHMQEGLNFSLRCFSFVLFASSQHFLRSSKKATFQCVILDLES